MDYEFLIKQKITELQDTLNELKQVYSFYLRKEDFASLDNISRQMYRNKYAIDILKNLL